MRVIPKLRRRSPDGRTGTMTLMEHLEELRHRLIVCVIAIGVGMVVGWFLFPAFLHILRTPYCDTVSNLPKQSQPIAGCRLVFTGLLEPTLVKLKSVFFLGLFVVSPVLLWQFWGFIVPGLTERERRMGIPFVVSSVALFALGGLVAYIMLPKGINFLLGFAGPSLTPLLSAGQFIGFVVLLTVAFGLSFEFPIVLIFLTLVGVLSSRKLRKWRRYSILFIAVFAAIITPSSDPYTMLAMMIPMCLFYEA